MVDRPISILYHGKDSPALVQSGYGKIIQYTAPRLMRAGYDIRIHAPVGHQTAVMEWKEPTTGEILEIWPGGNGMYGEDIIPAHLASLTQASGKQAALLFTGDVPPLNQIIQWASKREVLAAAWAAVDWEHPTPKAVLDRFRAWLYVWSYSRYGTDVLKADGLTENVLPNVWCGVNTEIWHPQKRGAHPDLWKAQGFREDGFNVFAAFANQYMRKGEFEMLAAVKRFDELHPEAKIHFNAFTQTRREWDFPATVEHMGLKNIVTLNQGAPDDYSYIMGRYQEQDVADMMSGADCVMHLGFEGFGLQGLEALACGLPIVGFDAGATPELLDSGAPRDTMGTTGMVSGAERGLLIGWDKEALGPPLLRRPQPSLAGLVEALEYVWKNREDPRFKRGPEWVKKNATWDICGDNLVKRLEAFERKIEDEELGGPPPPGPEAMRRAVRFVEVPA